MELIYKVQNLKCGGCANSITKKLSSLSYIADINVEPDSSTVKLKVNESGMEDQIKKALLNLGYPVEGDKNAFTSKAKSFVSCATGKMAK